MANPSVIATDNPADRMVTFRCTDCEHTFKSEPGRVVDAPGLAFPYEYFCDCELCGAELSQIWWEKNLFQAHVKATGPKTPEGKAAASANLEGYPTAEQMLRIRFNGLKNGAHAKTAIAFPAKPGKYAHCKTCDIDHDFCRQQPACLRRSELMLKYLAAVKSGDPSHLEDIHIVNQATVTAVLGDMMQEVINDGPTLRSPAYVSSKDGDISFVKDPRSKDREAYIMDVKAHPLLKLMMEFMQKNSMTLSDLNLTPKIHVDQNIMAGQLAGDAVDKERSADYQQKMLDQVSHLKSLVSRGKARLVNDKVLQEYQQEELDDDEGVIDVSPD
ncbi:hypothetical protein NO559_07685 [Dasania sp. GY-MA-18]|uniref:Uncharacterized protein n=1 Tax=Dasania phycosphaerae TaxID=2950436 RepID=A0A9J6RM66_9GAMM|nr:MULTISPECIES: hypothetical protein [Dasania]MCR8922647.1 hypothetical protein [Dasania sp. GY-MA-18]MCZ0865077.1 hypothetical protein [Dasania phycosphaerae]MCZ0868803.1 hypothetical protein [Dasania phycosphaerae]